MIAELQGVGSCLRVGDRLWVSSSTRRTELVADAEHYYWLSTNQYEWVSNTDHAVMRARRRYR